MPPFIARRYDTLRNVQVTIENGRIVALTPADNSIACPLIAPSLVDLQVNGYGGVEFNSPSLTIDQVEQVALAHDQFGVGALLATCTTDSFAALARSFTTIACARRERPAVAARIPGIHLEGPYISPLDGARGAHPLQHVRAPDWDEFRRLQDAAEGAIRLLTFAPEYDGAAAFIRRVVGSGVGVAIGHTLASSEQITAAVDAGARLSTHLGNGSPAMLRRHPNHLWDQLADDRLAASLIVDGHHLPPAVVKTMIAAKTAARCILVSDITSLAGMPAGRYETSLGHVEVQTNGRLTPLGQPELLAGASLPLHGCIPRAMAYAGLSLANAIDMASRQPAQLIGLDPPRLEVGAPANFMLFDLADDPLAPLVIRETYKEGGDGPLPSIEC